MSPWEDEDSDIKDCYRDIAREVFSEGFSYAKNAAIKEVASKVQQLISHALK